MPLGVRQRMQRVAQRDTAPELTFRRALSAHGIRYRVCPRDLPGRPDVANKRRRWAVFVHGCFWHAHAGCSKATVPKTNVAFWTAKLEANRARDEHKRTALKAQGYAVFTVWQCELDDPRSLARVVRAIARRRPR